ncbi:MAG: amino acid ABC transporter permease, partial [Brevibacterium yomogidense]
MLQAVLSGIPLTLGVTFVALVIGTAVSVPLLAGTLSKYRILWLLSRGVIDLLRGVPIVVWLFIF